MSGRFEPSKCQGPRYLEMEVPDFSIHRQSWVGEVPGCCWRPEQGDGIREKGGECLEITFLLAFPHNLTSTYRSLAPLVLLPDITTPPATQVPRLITILNG
jgi:hypothetical protein